MNPKLNPTTALVASKPHSASKGGGLSGPLFFASGKKVGEV